MLNQLLNTLILLPLATALICYAIRITIVRQFFVLATGIILTICSLMLMSYVPVTSAIRVLSGFDVNLIVQVADFVLLGAIILVAIKHKNLLIAAFSAAQIAVLGYFEFYMIGADHVGKATLYCDNLSLILVLIISIIGSIICIYALPYMKNHENHLKLAKSKQPRFFMLLFVFLGAMNGLVLANDLLHLYFFFEVTTLCSFFLIGHDGDEVSVKNSITALWMNSLGGLALLVGIVAIYNIDHTLDIQKVISMGGVGPGILIPVGLLCLAGFVKAAQMPFQKWLLGAMVAPTPTSALLHSSTMVKAGVYIVIRFSPMYQDTMLSTGIAICGAFTFLAGAALAMGQSNGKKVLAYSTISNLGLIIACAGINTESAITAAILLIIFHAVSKALLFLCVGSIEQHIGSRDIEDMRGLYAEMPKTSIIITLGILTMILPPFGMLLGKWMAIESASGNLFVVLLLALGSAITVVYWSRWAGILMGSSFDGESKPEKQSILEFMPLVSLLVAAIALSFTAPLIYASFIKPQMIGSDTFSVLNGIFANKSGSFILYPLSVISMMVFLFALLRTKSVSRKTKIVAPYMSGIQAEKAGSYVGPMDKVVNAISSNYYLNAMFGEQRITGFVNAAAGLLIVLMIGGAF